MATLSPSDSATPIAPGLTVAILTYRRPDYLAIAIDSVLAQTTLPAELMIVDDGSDEQTSLLVKRYQSAAPALIRYVWRENGGHSPARNTAVAECRTPYILWLDDDDELTPEAVEKQWAAIQAHPEADVVYGKLMLCDEKLAPLVAMNSHRLDVPNKLHLFFKHNPVPNPGTAAKVELFARVGEYDPKFRHAEDYDFWARAASAGANFHFNDALVCRYRSHPGNLATAEKGKRAAHERVWVIESLLARHNVEDIFAHLDWTTAPEQSLCRVCFEIAELVCRFGGHDSAVEALQNAAGMIDDTTLGFLKQLIQDTKVHGVTALETLSNHPQYRTEMAQRLVSSLLEFHCTPEQRDRFHVGRWHHELTVLPLRALFPQLPWESDATQASAIAHGAAAGYFVMHGAFASALGLIAKPESGIAPEAQAAATELLNAAAVGSPLDNPRWMEQGGHVVMQFLHMLKLRDERFKDTGQKPPLTDSFAGPELRAEPAVEKLAPPPPAVEALPAVISLSLPLLREAVDMLAATELATSPVGHLTRPRGYISTITPATRAADKIAVVIPTFNRPQLVVHAVRSALLQPVEALQVIVINDAGDELPETTLDEWRRSQRVTYVRHQQNTGLGGARNTGISLATAERVVVLDDDDQLVPGALALLLRVSEQTNSPFVTGDHLRSHYEGSNELPSKTTYHHRSETLEELLAFENGIVSGSAIITRELLNSIGGYREDFHVHEDYNLHLRLAALIEPRQLPIPVMNYHLRTSIERMNNDRRLYWFATSALNHQYARWLVQNNDALRQQQRIAQYAHVARALREGCSPKVAGMLVGAWLQALSDRGLSTELELQIGVISATCNELVPEIQNYMQQGQSNEIGAVFAAQ